MVCIDSDWQTGLAQGHSAPVTRYRHRNNYSTQSRQLRTADDTNTRTGSCTNNIYNAICVVAAAATAEYDNNVGDGGYDDDDDDMMMVMMMIKLENKNSTYLSASSFLTVTVVLISSSYHCERYAGDQPQARKAQSQSQIVGLFGWEKFQNKKLIDFLFHFTPRLGSLNKLVSTITELKLAMQLFPQINEQF